MRRALGVVGLVFAVNGTAQAQFSVSAADFAEGAGQFLVDRASEEVTSYVAERFLYRLCRQVSDETDYRVTARALLPRTCELIDPQSGGDRFQSLSALSIGAFRANLRADFQMLGHHLLAVALPRLDSSRSDTDGPLTVQDHAIFALDLAQAVFRAALLQGDASQALDMEALKASAFTDGRERFGAAWNTLTTSLAPLHASAIASADAIRRGFTGVDASVQPLLEATQLEERGRRAEALMEAVLGIIQTQVVSLCPADPSHARYQCQNVALEAFAMIQDFVGGRFASGIGRALGSVPLRDTVLSAFARRFSASHVRSDEQQRWLETAMRFVSLAADIASAENAGSVRALFDAFAAPTGTWRGKHEPSTWGLTFQGYAGLSLGTENVGGEWSGSFGPTLSFGIQLHAVRAPSRARFLTYISLIDLGNLVSLSFAGGATAEAVPDVTWAQLFSPGVHIGTSLGRSPIDLLAGVSYVPVLRTVEGEREGVLRFSVSLLVDVTILRLAGR